MTTLFTAGTKLTADALNQRAGTIGGKRYTAGGNLASAIAGTEVVANMDSGLVVHPPNTIFEVTVNMIALQSVAVGNTNIFRVRENTVAGTQRMEYLWIPQSAAQAWEIQFAFEYETSSAPAAITWTVTGQRLSGANTFDVQAGTANKTVSVRVNAIGPAGAMTII